MNSPVLSGTEIPVLSGTRFPCYQEPKGVITLCSKKLNRTPSNCTNLDSFGILLTEGVFLSSWPEDIVFVRVERDITATTPLFYYDHLRFATPFYDKPPATSLPFAGTAS